ncbi:DMT family transporter [Orbus sturtevantii]|uniref:DMT family transporter n=1 Tax=Orbus sturtevantii TaxID=3074109 RepID=UPI00370D21BB
MPYILLALAACFWGGNYVVGHLLVVNSDPMVLSEGRWAITALLLCTLYHRQVIANYSKIKQSIKMTLFLAVFGQVLFPLTLYIGLQYTTSLNAAIYMSATPAMVLLINKLVFNDQISKNNIIGVLLSSLGVLYLIFKGDLSNFDALKNLNKGDLWAMGSAISWAFYCSFLRKKDKSIPHNVFVTISSLLGTLILLPIALVYFMFFPITSFSAYTQLDFIIGLLYLVIFPSWLAYLFWNRGIAQIGATRGEVYTHLIPLSGGIFSIVFLNTQIHLFHLISATLIILGIFLCSKK